jgi:haloacetate dehalogenase
MCEDYRAGPGIDRANDDADRAAGRRIACPLLVLWATKDDLGDLYGDDLGVWRGWAGDLRGGELDCGSTWPRRLPPSWAPSSPVKATTPAPAQG